MASTRNKPRPFRAIVRRLAPNSLFGRLFLAFSFGFMAILAFGAFHLSATKQYYVLRGVLSDRTQRIANMALLLDTVPVAERALIAERVSIRGFSLRMADEAPDLSGQTPEQYADSAARLGAMLDEARENLAAKGEDVAGRNIEDAPSTPMAGSPMAGSPMACSRVAVLSVSVPGLYEEFLAAWRYYTGIQPPRDSLPIYRAIVAVPLSDGSWVVFQDTAPNFSGLWGLPFKGILTMEVFFMLVSLVAFYLIVKPLRRLAQAAESFGRDVPGTPPLPESGPREVREAAQAFNRMQRRIRDFVDQRGRTLAAVSHDLRTPLTRMRLRVEQLDEAARLPLQKDMDELQQLMDTTIDLARASGGEAMAPVDVAALLESLVDDHRDMGRNVRLENPEELELMAPLLARPLSIKRSLNNLLDNAARYGGDEISIRVEDNPEELAIILRDHGPGIPEDSLAHVFEPFYRLEPSRNRETGGNGLGLAIAQGMARAHGGDLVLANHPQGGLIARITFRRYRKM